MLKRIINDLLNRLAILYHVGTISLAVFAFMAPMLVPIPDDPTNQAGLHAALVALCMGGLIFAETASWGGSSIQRIRRFSPLGSCVRPFSFAHFPVGH